MFILMETLFIMDKSNAKQSFFHSIPFGDYILGFIFVKFARYTGNMGKEDYRFF